MTTINFTPSALRTLKLPQLRALAKERGIRRLSTMRKSEIIAALLKLQRREKQASSSRTSSSVDTEAASHDISLLDDNTLEASSSLNSHQDRQEEQSVRESSVLGEKDNGDHHQGKSRRSSQARTQDNNHDHSYGVNRKRNGQSGFRRLRREAQAPQQEPASPVLDIREELKVDLDSDAGEQGNHDNNRRVVRERKRRNRDDQHRERDWSRRERNNHGEHNDKSERQDRSQYNNSSEAHEREDASEQSETRVSTEEVMLPIAGILDIQQNHAFVRTSGYLPGPNDVYVTLGQVRRWALRPGDAICGAVRQRDEADPSARRQKYNALVRLDTVNNMTVEQARQRKEFKALTPLYPQQQLRLETGPQALTQRTIDLVAPIGKGQRGLIVSPPKAGKTIILQQIANAITVNNPECHLMVVLVDERPEEVTDMQRTVKGEIIASTFDRPASDHTTVAELAIERAKRLVELDQDVIVLLDSITRLGRAYNLAAPASGRILSGGVDASALYPPKRFFGAARNVENGGSLTILATALVETGSKMDEVIFEEFKGTGNMELRLSRELADKRIFPAVDVNASGTRREELLLTKEELAIIWKLRRMMGALEPGKATEFVLSKLKQTSTNTEFLMALAKMTPAKD